MAMCFEDNDKEKYHGILFIHLPEVLGIEFKVQKQVKSTQYICEKR